MRARLPAPGAHDGAVLSAGAAAGQGAGAPDDLIVERPEGLWCPPGGFHIDPWRPVERAVVTHAHADHASRGHGHYLASARSEGVLRTRLGAGIDLQPLAWGEAVVHNGVRVSLHPAGHVLGSAQVRVEHRGRVWVASGDYWLTGRDGEKNATCDAFEPVACDCFITESTFGLPIYRWRPQREIFDAIDAWWRANADAGRASLLMGYSFGKAQRILAGVDASIGPIVVHGAVEPLNRAYRAEGVAIPPTHPDERAGGQGTAEARPRRRPALGAGQRLDAAPAATTARPSPAAGCSCAARAAGAASSAASCSPTTPTGPACSAPSPPPAPSASSSPTATRR